MRKSLKQGAGLVAVGVGSAVAAAEAAEHGAKTLAVAAALLAGACTSLGVTSVIAGPRGRRPVTEDGDA